MTILTRGLCGLLAALMLTVAGCVPATGKVKGHVKLPDGRPAVGVTVTFEESQQHLGASGTTDAEGVYRLGINAPGDGAPAGNYVVSIHQPGPADSSQPQPPRVFPIRYESSATSGLTCEVKPGDNNFDIKLEAK